MPLTLVTPPSSTPVTLAEAKAHLRVDGTADEALITALIDAATAHLDGYSGILGRALVTQTWALTMDSLPGDGFKLSLPPIQSVTSITYVDSDGATQALASDQYVLSGDHVRPAYGVTWPTPRDQADAVTVIFVVGYGDAADVPGPIKAAMLLMIGDLYANREGQIVGTISGPNRTVDALVAPYRAWGFQ